MLKGPSVSSSRLLGGTECGYAFDRLFRSLFRVVDEPLVREDCTSEFCSKLSHPLPAGHPVKALRVSGNGNFDSRMEDTQTPRNCVCVEKCFVFEICCRWHFMHRCINHHVLMRSPSHENSGKYIRMNLSSLESVLLRLEGAAVLPKMGLPDIIFCDALPPKVFRKQH